MYERISSFVRLWLDFLLMLMLMFVPARLDDNHRLREHNSQFLFYNNCILKQNDY
jgi:hypothetical protein